MENVYCSKSVKQITQILHVFQKISEWSENNNRNLKTKSLILSNYKKQREISLFSRYLNKNICSKWLVLLRKRCSTTSKTTSCEKWRIHVKVDVWNSIIPAITFHKSDVIQSIRELKNIYIFAVWFECATFVETYCWSVDMCKSEPSPESFQYGGFTFVHDGCTFLILIKTPAIFRLHNSIWAVSSFVCVN